MTLLYRTISMFGRWLTRRTSNCMAAYEVSNISNLYSRGLTSTTQAEMSTSVAVLTRLLIPSFSVRARS